MNQHDKPPEQLHRTSEDKLSKPRLRGQLLHPDELHAGSLLTDSSPSRFGGMRLGIEESVVGLLIYFPLLALLRWVFGRRGHSIPAPSGDKANKSPGDYVAVKYAATTTIRQDIRTATGSRANRTEETIMSGSSSYLRADHDIEAGASAPSFPRPRPLLPPLSIDEVLQKSVWGFREKWWPTSSTAAFEAARIEEAEGNVGGIRGFDMNPETKAFLDKYVYSHPLCISISISLTCPAVEEDVCCVPWPSASDAVYPLPSSTSTSPLSVSSACPAVEEHTCLVPLPTVANAVEASFSSAAEETTGCTRADTTENDVAGSIIAGSGLSPAVVSSTPVVVRPTLSETLSLGEVDPETLLSRVESRLPLSQGFAGMEAISLDLSDGVTGGQLDRSDFRYDGDYDDDNDDNTPSSSLIMKGTFIDSSEQQEEEKTEEMGEDEQEEEDMEAISRADGTIGGSLRTIGSDEDNDGDNDDVRYLGSNRFAVLFETSDEEEEEQEDDMESISLADMTVEEKLLTIGSDDGNDNNDSNDARYVSNNRFAVLFESSDEEEEEEEEEKQEEEEEWGNTWGEECDEEEEEADEREKPKEEKEARQMEMEDDEAQEMQEKWREIDEEWEAMEEWIEDDEGEEEEGEQESVNH